MKLLIATHNPGKFAEIQAVLLPLGVEMCSLSALSIMDVCAEEGDTFASNALGKARFFHALSGLPTVADDSGIFVEALADELGVQTRRWGAGERASDAEWLDFFMERMQGVSNRAARFVCAAAYVDEACQKVFEGETEGVITETLRAPLKSGIPLSSVFLPKGCGEVYSALRDDEKNKLSHRGKAMAELLMFLKQHR